MFRLENIETLPDISGTSNDNENKLVYSGEMLNDVYIDTILSENIKSLQSRESLDIPIPFILNEVYSKSDEKPLSPIKTRVKNSNESDDKTIVVNIYTRCERNEKIKRYREKIKRYYKRKKLGTNKSIYQSRVDFARNRQRVCGRFM